MTRDYKPRPQKSAGRGSAFLSGLLIGILLGVGLSLAVTIFIKGSENPFISEPKPAANVESKKSSDKKTENHRTETKETVVESKEAESKYDFYTILPETESTVTEQEIKNAPKPVKKDSYFLQVGAFQNEADADNMKAKLALQGFEAVIQTATIADKGTWHRVRVGPLNDLDQINKVRGELTASGFNTDLIKVHTETKTD